MRKVSFKMVKMHPSEGKLGHSHKCNGLVIKLITGVCGFHSFLLKTFWYWQKFPLSFLVWGHVVDEQTSPPLSFLVSTPQELSWPPGRILALSQMRAQCSPRACGVVSLSSVPSAPAQPLSTIHWVMPPFCTYKIMGISSQEIHIPWVLSQRVCLDLPAGTSSPLLEKLGFCRRWKLTFYQPNNSEGQSLPWWLSANFFGKLGAKIIKLMLLLK